jgi:hypothetical protein
MVCFLSQILGKSRASVCKNWEAYIYFVGSVRNLYYPCLPYSNRFSPNNGSFLLSKLEMKFPRPMLKRRKTDDRSITDTPYVPLDAVSFV